MDLIVKSIEEITPRISLFTLQAADGGDLPSYTAGAHMDVTLKEIGPRSYSLIDFETQSTSAYQIAVQREPDGLGGSKQMHRLNVGDPVTAEEPKNDFALSDGPALLIAGGIGVTPLISMAQSLSQSQTGFQFHYAARSADVMGFQSQLEALHGEKANFWFDDVKPIDLEAVIADRPNEAHVYVCGPKPMIEAVKAVCTAQNLPPENVHFELFSTPAPEQGDTAFEVEIQDTGEVHTVPAGKTIIEVLEEAGLDVMYDCQRGDCGICQTDVISGTPDHRDVVLSDEEKASGTVMQICVSRAKSDRLVLDI